MYYLSFVFPVEEVQGWAIYKLSDICVRRSRRKIWGFQG